MCVLGDMSESTVSWRPGKRPGGLGLRQTPLGVWAEVDKVGSHSMFTSEESEVKTISNSVGAAVAAALMSAASSQRKGERF